MLAVFVPTQWCSQQLDFDFALRPARSACSNGCMRTAMTPATTVRVRLGKIV